ncbi:oxysterol-binding protein-related protein 8-like isoform X2 [Dendronephthya gigantea]|uniref:oxysterol-binding protein-related protein 8-like isoform X2 n=1 Tax=Dendronephthya gigantea TaxID=151771 RepID=UPI00106D4EBE|nr:oxysterol-binding protein-related protein 8-like isoform X2 [Dendronephthya gigantea]
MAQSTRRSLSLPISFIQRRFSDNVTANGINECDEDAADIIGTPSTPSTPGDENGEKGFIRSDSTSRSPTRAVGRKAPDRSPKFDRKVSLKEMKKSYKHEKRRMAKKVTSTMLDPAVIILSSWLKIRGTLKNWARFWCLVKPGALIIYRNDKEEQWVGTVILNGCEVIERPSKKEGFCFKIYHPLQNYIWATKGPRGEIAGALVGIPLPKDHLILRAASESDGKCWLDALEVSHKQAYNMHRDSKGMVSDLYGKMTSSEDLDEETAQAIGQLSIRERDIDEISNDAMDKSDSEDDIGDQEVKDEGDEGPHVETVYVEENEPEYLGESGEATEDMEDEGKSILWTLMKQVKPGMDLSKVVLPTFILEPRSFLDKLSDFYYHADILSKAVKQESPYDRMKHVVKWYLSGFYKKPKGLKKPYNPIIGERFRCYWSHQETDSRTFFVAEQLSHHPPISGFYVANRQDGFVVNGCILAKSKFYGNSTSAIMDGLANLTLLPHGEDYVISMPYAHCKGLLIGTLTMEYGGTVKIECEKTGYHTEIEFKLKPFWKKSGESNRIAGKIKMGKETLCKLEGKWDGEVLITDLRSGNRETEEDLLPDLFWEPTPDVRNTRLKRHVPDLDSQEQFESQNLWRYVSDAIRASDQVKATEEKFKLEEDQRRVHRELKEKCEKWITKLFDRDPAHPEAINKYIYKYKNVRPWDPITDLHEYEHEFKISTRTRIKAPMVKQQSLVAMEVHPPSQDDDDKLSPQYLKPTGTRRKYGRQSPDRMSSMDEDDVSSFAQCLKPLRESQAELKEQIRSIRSDMRRYQIANREQMASFHTKDWIFLLFFVIALLWQWYQSTLVASTRNTIE